MELGAAATSKPPQISEMFQKFAIAFKAKTFELFAEEEESAANSAAVSAAVSDNEDGFTLLDSTEDFITDQKVIIIKPDLKSQNQIVSASIIQPFNTRFAQVNENQNKLRALETMFNRLQSDIDGKDDKVLMLKKQLGETEDCNSKLSMKLSKNLKPPNGFLPTIRVFDSMLRDACRSSHRFTKLLIQLMKKAGWDLGLAANYVHPDVGYVKKGHNRYAFLSYVSLGMFQGFDSENFGLAENVASNDNSMELFEHVLVNPLETLNKNPSCAFSKFCERKYEELVHPTMESSIFKNLDRKKEVLDSWRSLSVFYEAFVNMSSSMWLLHKLARSFHPTVEIFQVEKGVDFSMVYMEDVTKKDAYHDKGISEVGFTVVPGFKIGKTVIQSQVYLTGSNRTK
ncbi:protein of unknown function DUF641, plant [Cynara cardunculus var. scolymus]|uniref:DUF641 domain-containing protein n=1 Tax=Cynara cardunculus var. scolymus TaxID=59895 RepID=A0A103XEE6_CYNCS|nr:protein of unknown function DUF641, plant [Cynara cardunculus var. scolymus]